MANYIRSIFEKSSLDFLSFVTASSEAFKRGGVKYLEDALAVVRKMSDNDRRSLFSVTSPYL